MKSRKRISTQIAPSTHRWYLDRFGSARWGATYVLEAFPRLYEKTLAALSPSDVSDLTERIVAAGPQTCSFMGHVALSFVKGKDLSLFARICLELQAFAGKEGGFPRFEACSSEDKDIPLTPDLEVATTDFYENLFRSRNQGVNLVLSLFPKWFEETVYWYALDDQASSVHGLVIAHPWAAGAHILSAFDEKGPRALQGKIDELPLFALACLEILASPQAKCERNRPERSPYVKVTPSIYSEHAACLEDIFGSAHAGVSFAAEAFPAMYRQALQDLQKSFSEMELNFLRDLLKNHSPAGGNASGQLILELVRGYSGNMPFCKDSLLEILHKTPAFHRLCLEVWGSRALHAKMAA